MSAFTTTATTALVILAMTVGQYDCRHPFHFNTCDNVTKSICFNALNAMAQNMGPASLDDDEACTVVDREIICLRSCLMSPGERALIRSMEYVCDPSIREDVRAASRAECFRDKSLQLTLMGKKAHMCAFSATMIFEEYLISNSGSVTESNQICPMINHMTHCFTDDLKGMCGEMVVPVFSGMFQAAIKGVLGDSTVESCINQHATVRRAVSTSFELVRK